MHVKVINVLYGFHDCMTVKSASNAKCQDFHWLPLVDLRLKNIQMGPFYTCTEFILS